MKWGKTMLVVFGAVVVTALGIDAADTMTGKSGTLLSQLAGSNDANCPSGMVAVANVPSVQCIDVYENSTGEKCPMPDPDNIIGSLRNIESGECIPRSVENALPWRYISRDLAMQACARAGKRLPTSEEWYTLSLGITNIDASCNVSSRSVSKTGMFDACSSPHGAYDLVGNVWEWVSDDVINGVHDSTELPNSGYVTQVNRGGMAVVTSESEDVVFGSDYFWTEREGAYGIIRGGYYDSGTDAGLYAVHADTVPTTASIGIGFRCVK